MQRITYRAGASWALFKSNGQEETSLGDSYIFVRLSVTRAVFSTGDWVISSHVVSEHDIWLPYDVWLFARLVLIATQCDMTEFAINRLAIHHHCQTIKFQNPVRNILVVSNCNWDDMGGVVEQCYAMDPRAR